MIKNLIFDLGGVFLKLNKAKACLKFKELGITNIEELLDSYLQKGAFLGIEDGSLSSEDFALELEKIAGKEIKQEEIMEAYMDFIDEVQEYKFDFIDELSKNYPIYLLSNTNPYIIEFAESDTFLSNGRKLSSYFSKMFMSCELGLVKPNPKIFQEVIKEAKLIPEETLFIDDGANNIATAKSLGFKTYQPDNGEDWREALIQIIKTQ